MEYLQLFAQEGEPENPTNGDAGAAASRPEAAEHSPNTAGVSAPAAQAGGDVALRAHFDGLQRQAEALRRQFPDFDLGRELENPVFLRLTAPGIGVSLEDAYYATHRQRLQQAAAQALRTRPQENGTASHAPAVTAFDYRNASPQQREALKKAIRDAKARGEKLYPRG